VVFRGRDRTGRWRGLAPRGSSANRRTNRVALAPGPPRMAMMVATMMWRLRYSRPVAIRLGRDGLRPPHGRTA
jgi:hypothetical protein